MQWISSYGQDNSASDNYYYNVHQIQYIAFGPSDGGAYEVMIGMTNGGITGAVIYNGYAALSDAQAKAQELADATGGSARWISSYGHDNASNTAYYNIDQIQAVTFEAHDSAYAVVLYITAGEVTSPQYIYTGYSTLDDARVVAQGVIAAIGGEVS